MQNENSDITLTVPPGAVPDGHTYEITSDIHVNDLDNFKNHVKWEKNERFIAAVPEYNITKIINNGQDISANTDNTFLQWVTIEIPHCQEDPRCLPYIKVYASNPEQGLLGQLVQKVKTDKEGVENNMDTFYTVTVSRVTIYTKHFTQFICTCGEQFELFMGVLLFGKFKQYREQEVQLKVYFCEQLHQLRDFRQVCIRDGIKSYLIVSYDSKGY